MWSPSACPENVALKISYEAFLSLDERQVGAVKLSVSSNSSVEILITDILDGHSANRTSGAEPRFFPPKRAILTSVKPNGVDNVTAYIYSTVRGDLPQYQKGLSSDPDTKSISQSYSVRLDPAVNSVTASFVKYVGVMSTEHFPDAKARIIKVVDRAATTGWKALRSAHTAQVALLMHNDFLADFRDPATGALPEDSDVRSLQITAIASAYYLYTSLLPYDESNAALSDSLGNSLPVNGLISDSYGGKIFWEADLFVAPAIMGTHPRLARQFSTYRIRRAAAALENPVRHGLEAGSMLFPWTSGRYGQRYNMTAQCVMYQYHLSADIVLSLVMARNTSGDYEWFDNLVAPVIDGLAKGLSQVMVHYPDNDTWGIPLMTDAGGYYVIVADGSFTSSAVSVVLEIASNLRREAGKPLEDNWPSIIENPAIPTSDDGIVLEFRDMQNDIVSKQPHVMLMDYPFGYRRGFGLEKRRLALEYYSVRQDPAGPAMTHVIYAISANSLLESGCAFWTFLLKSILPFVRAPWYQFSEQQNDDPDANVGSSPLNDTEPRFFGGGTNPAFPFLTGHGGLLQVMTAGFMGVRTTDVNLVLNPSLPPQLKHFKAPVQFYNGAVVDCRMNRTHTVITRRDASNFDGIVPDRYGDGAMPITVGRSADDPDGYKIHLKTGETAVVANRQYSDELTAPGNILQCNPSSSPDPHIPGQFPLAATDGYPGTSWQPESDSAASLIVDLAPTGEQPAVELDRVLLDFATRPPKNIRVLLSNDSSFADPPEQQQQPLGQWIPVTVSRPWVAASPVVRYAGNSTTVELPRGVWSGRYARLDVEGCWAGDGAGPTVAEFSLVARGGDAAGAVEPVAAGHDEL